MATVQPATVSPAAKSGKTDDCADKQGSSSAGVLQPLTGATTKESGRRVARFGPMLTWGIDHQDATVQVCHFFNWTCTSMFRFATGQLFSISPLSL